MPRLLVVDDSATIRKSVELSFKDLPSHSLDFASSGEEGIRRAFAKPPDLILLDFVLPDMKGPDVCRRLVVDLRTDRIPVLLLTGKDGAVMELFRAFSNVKGYIQKPFSPSQLRDRVQALLPPSALPAGAAEAAREEASSASDFAQRQLGAQALYALLKEPFARIPQMLSELGEQSAPQFFARKLLTPELLSSAFDALRPFIARNDFPGPEGPSPAAPGGGGGGSAVPPAPASSDGGATLLSGALSPQLRALEVIRLASTHGETTRLVHKEGSDQTIVYLRDGSIIFATETHPEVYGNGLGQGLVLEAPSTSPERLREQAYREQRETGRPFHLLLVERGALAVADLGGTLFALGLRTLHRLVACTSGTFELAKIQGVPPYVEAYARPISFPQLELELARLSMDAQEVSRLVPRHDAVYARCEGFNRLVTGYTWASEERRLLAALDGRSTVLELAVRLGVSTQELLPTLASLVAVGLARPLWPATAPLRKVAVQDMTGDAFKTDLRTYLERRSQPLAFVSVGLEEDLLKVVESERPFLLIVNGPFDRLHKVARGLHTVPAARALTLATVLDGGTEEDARVLLASGFNVVLRKPLHVSDLEWLLLEARGTLSAVEADLRVARASPLEDTRPGASPADEHTPVLGATG